MTINFAKLESLLPKKIELSSEARIITLPFNESNGSLMQQVSLLTGGQDLVKTHTTGRNGIILPNCNATLEKLEFRWLRSLPIHNEDTEYFTVQIEGIKVGPDFTINLTRTIIIQSPNKGSLKNGKYTIDLNLCSKFIECIESTSYVTLNVTSIKINGNILPVVGFIES